MIKKKKKTHKATGDLVKTLIIACTAYSVKLVVIMLADETLLVKIVLLMSPYYLF